MNMTALYSCFGVILGLLVLALIALGVMQFLLEKKKFELKESENDVAAPLPLEVCAEDVLLRIRNAEIDTIAPLFGGDKETSKEKNDNFNIQSENVGNEEDFISEAAISKR